MREKLIELLREVQYLGGLEEKIADHLIANGVTLDNQVSSSKWIPVSERLPEAHRLVLCRWTRGVGASYGFARYNHDINVWYVSNEGMPNVTHWMPLPEPPKEE